MTDRNKQNQPNREEERLHGTDERLDRSEESQRPGRRDGSGRDEMSVADDRGMGSDRERRDLSGREDVDVGSPQADELDRQDEEIGGTGRSNRER